MALRTEYCEDYVLFGMEKKQRKVVFGLQVFEGLSKGEGNRWGLRGAQEAELCDLWTRRNSLTDSPWAALQRSKESGCLWEVTERALEKTRASESWSSSSKEGGVEGGKHQGHLACRAGPILHWVLSSHSSGPALPSSSLLLGSLLPLLPLSNPFSTQQPE